MNIFRNITYSYIGIVLINWIFFVVSQGVLIKDYLRFNKLANVFLALLVLLCYIIVFLFSYKISKALKSLINRKIGIDFLPYLIPNLITVILILSLTFIDNKGSSALWFDIFIPLFVTCTLAFLLSLIAVLTTPSESPVRDSAKNQPHE